mmetsp:Transcript_47872/g.48283  ORF Transcript_47872/g.48283 Transcript_47872/m.48283 type:complete len:106 (+) Transcript_47872:277-594(+)
MVSHQRHRTTRYVTPTDKNLKKHGKNTSKKAIHNRNQHQNTITKFLSYRKVDILNQQQNIINSNQPNNTLEHPPETNHKKTEKPTSSKQKLPKQTQRNSPKKHPS